MKQEREKMESLRNRVENDRIVKLMGEIEDYAQKMFHELNKNLEENCMTALDSNDLQVKMIARRDLINFFTLIRKGS